MQLTYRECHVHSCSLRFSHPQVVLLTLLWIPVTRKMAHRQQEAIAQVDTLTSSQLEVKEQSAYDLQSIAG